MTEPLLQDVCPNCARYFNKPGALIATVSQLREFSADLDESGVVVVYSHIRALDDRSLPREPQLIEEEVMYLRCAGCGFTIAVPHDEFDAEHHVADASTIESEHLKG